MLGNMSKSYIAGAWVTVANIGGTGTATVESPAIAIPLPENYVDIIYEISFTQTVVSGGDLCLAWAKNAHLQAGLLATDGAFNPIQYTCVFSTSTTKNRIGATSLKIHSNVNNGSTSEGGAFQYFNVRGKGNSAGTVWTVTNIKARAIYLPL